MAKMLQNFLFLFISFANLIDSTRVRFSDCGIDYQRNNFPVEIILYNQPI